MSARRPAPSSGGKANMRAPASGGAAAAAGAAASRAGMRTVFDASREHILLACVALACLALAIIIRRRAMRRELQAQTQERSRMMKEAVSSNESPPSSPPVVSSPVVVVDEAQRRAEKLARKKALVKVPRPDHLPAKVRPLPPADLAMPKVAIVGGGLAGLSCALSLQRAGVPVTVYERDESLAARKQGFGLTLTNNPVGALAELGVLDTCVKEDCPSTAHWVLKPNGQVLGYYGRSLQEESDAAAAVSPTSPSSSASGDREASASLRIPREDLRRMLYERLAPGTVEWGCRLRDYTEDLKADGAPVTLQFEDGRSVACDLLVGADGIHSVVRRLRDAKERDANAGLRYLGVCVILGISPAEHPMLDARGIYVVDGAQRLFTMPFRPPGVDAATGAPVPPQTMWQLSFACTDEAEARALKSAPPSELLSFALARTRGWLEPVEALIGATPDSDLWSTPLYDRDAMRLRAKDRASLVTVAGDAAHPMSMFKGQGANQALQDGPSLAAWVRHQHSNRRDTSASLASGMTRASLLTRVRQYESEVVHRSAPRVLDSREAAAFYHSPRACELSAAYGLGNIGLRPGEVGVVEVLRELEAQGISAAELGTDLEARVRDIIRQMTNEREQEEETVTQEDAQAAAIRRRAIKAPVAVPVVR